MLPFLFSVALAQTQPTSGMQPPSSGMVCVSIKRIEITECTEPNRLGRAAGGAALGAVGGYMLGGRKWAKWGAVAGGASGAVTGSTVCTKRFEDTCEKWEARKEVKNDSH